MSDMWDGVIIEIIDPIGNDDRRYVFRDNYRGILTLFNVESIITALKDKKLSIKNLGTASIYNISFEPETKTVIARAKII